MKKNMAAQGLGSRLTRQITLLMVLVIVSGIGATSSVLTKIISTQLEKSIETLGHEYLQDLDLYFTFMDQTIDRFSKNQMVVNCLIDPERREIYLPQLAKEFTLTTFVIDLAVVDFTGNEVYGSSGQPAIPPNHPNLRKALATESRTVQLVEHSLHLRVIQPVVYYQTTQGAVVVTLDLGAMLREIFAGGPMHLFRVYSEDSLLLTVNERPGASYVYTRHIHDQQSSHRDVQRLALTLEIGILQEEYHQPIRHAILSLMVLSLFFLAVAMLVGRRMGEQLAKPIVHLCAKVQQSGRTDKALPCSPVGTGDELEELALAFDARTSQLLTTQDDLRHKNEWLEEEIRQRQAAEKSLQASYEDLEEKIRERTMELQVAKESLDKAQEIAHLGNWDWDIANDTLWWSDEIYRIFGRDPQSFTATYDTFMEMIHPEDRQIVDQAVIESMTTHQSYRVEHRVVLPDGRQRYVLEQGELEVDNTGVPMRMVGTILDINERKEMEMLLKKDEERLSSLLNLSQKAWESEEELTDFALEEAVRLTSSAVGYLHFVNPEDDTLELSTWSDNVREECRAYATPHYSISSAGIWADSVRTKKPVTHNDYPALSEKKGLPEGHFPIKRHMSIPVFDNESVIAVVGVGNKEEPYDDQDTRQLTLFMSSMWQILKRKRVEDELFYSRQMLQVVLDNIPQRVFWKDRQDNYLGGNKLFLQDAGMASLEELIGKNDFDMPWREDANLYRADDQEVMESSTPKLNIEEPHHKADGQAAWALTNKIPLKDTDNHVYGILGTYEDITARKQSEEQLQKLASELAILYDVSITINQSIDLHDTLADILQAILNIEILALEKKAVLFLAKDERLVLAHEIGHDQGGLPQFLEEHTSIDFNTCLCGLAAKTGEIIVSKNSATDPRHSLQYPEIPDHGHIIIPLQAKRRLVGVLCLYVAIATDISDEIKGLLITLGNQIGMAIDNATLYEETRALSLHDPLTGFANRRHMGIIMEDNLSKARRFGTSFSIIMFDIDHFKKFNDTYGHDEGDRILVQTANVVGNQLREIDLKVRFGGEEFIIILPDTPANRPPEVAERIRLAVEQEVSITISLGVTTYQEGDSQNKLLKRADEALYRAKEQGRNRVIVG